MPLPRRSACCNTPRTHQQARRGHTHRHSNTNLHGRLGPHACVQTLRTHQPARGGHTHRHAAAGSLHVHAATCSMCMLLLQCCRATPMRSLPRCAQGAAGNGGGQWRRPACTPGGSGRGAPWGAPRELRDAGLCREGGAGCRGMAGPPPLCSLPAPTTLLPSTQLGAGSAAPAPRSSAPSPPLAPLPNLPCTHDRNPLPRRACAGGGATRDREEGPLFAQPPGSFRSFRSRATERPFAQFLFDLQLSPIISLAGTKFDRRQPAPTL
jgi:hypothetical protein